jgi:hypothetical protein
MQPVRGLERSVMTEILDAYCTLGTERELLLAPARVRTP